MEARWRAGLGASMALAAAVAGGQSNPAQGYMDMASGMMQTSMLNMAIRNAGEPHGANRKGGAGKVGAARLTYTESPAVTARVKKNFVAFLRAQGLGDGAASMEAYLAKRDFRKDWARLSASDGLARGNALDAMVEYWIVNWQIANGKTEGSTRAQAQGLKRQIAPLMAVDPTFAKLTNAQRQEIAEVWMINAVAQAGGYTTALRSGDRTMVEKASAAAATRFKNEAKIDLRAVELTRRGFVKA